MDFTVRIYRKLLDQLIKSGYTFQTFSDFLEKPEERTILLRHDVDAKKFNSLHFAQIQNKLGIKGSYYFRIVPQSYDEDVIKKIADLGHEIGYHYEDMDLASSKFDVRSLKLKEEDLYDVAIESFQENLEKLRKLYPVKTICMHGSPWSKFDNKALWKKYNYRDYGIVGEPYFDIDFNEVFYLTDTGRRWDGYKVSIRDKVDSSTFGVQGSGFRVQGLDSNDNKNCRKSSFHSTREIIGAAERNELPDRIMFTFHPQRWNDKAFPWLKELVMQNVKNQVKRFLVKK